MPPNKPQTALSLEAFREVIGYPPFIFYQLANALVPLTDSSNLVVTEYTWQNPQAASRNDFRRAIQTAEQKLCDLLNYDVSTRYRTEALDSNYLRSLARGNSNQPGYGYGSGYYGGGYGYYGYGYGYGTGPTLIQLEVGKLQHIGTVGYTALNDFAITLSDEDGDGVNDTFTGTLTDSATDPTTVVIAFSDTDQLPGSAVSAGTSDPTDWLIRPVTVTRLNSTTLQVVGPSWLAVKPSLYEKATPAAGYNSSQTGVSSSGTFDPNAATGVYVTTLAAWVKGYTDENLANYVRRYGGDEYISQVPVTVVNADLGQVQIDLNGCYGGTAPSFYSYPGTEELRINYEAGATAADYKRFPYLKYQTDWETIVSRFAVAELPQVPSATQKQNPVLYFYREDLAKTGNLTTGGAGETYRISNDILNNPFRNTRRGAVEAFQAVQSLAQHRAVNF